VVGLVVCGALEVHYNRISHPLAKMQPASTPHVNKAMPHTSSTQLATMAFINGGSCLCRRRIAGRMNGRRSGRSQDANVPGSR
jgi:hypothetical protein